MSKKASFPQRAGRALLWPILPVLFAFRPGYRATRDALRVLQEVPTLAPVERIDRAAAGYATDDAVRLRLAALARARMKTRCIGRLFAGLLALDLAWWLWRLAGGAPLGGPLSAEALAAAVVLGSQYLVQAHGNWQIRRGRSGSIAEFLEDGRNLWPR
jgi:hypothetical protein